MGISLEIKNNGDRVNSVQMNEVNRMSLSLCFGFQFILCQCNLINCCSQWCVTVCIEILYDGTKINCLKKSESISCEMWVETIHKSEMWWDTEYRDWWK